MRKLVLAVVVGMLGIGSVMAGDIWGDSQNWRMVNQRDVVGSSLDPLISSSPGYLKSVTFSSSAAGDYCAVLDSINWGGPSTLSTTAIILDPSIDTARGTTTWKAGGKGLYFNNLFIWCNSVNAKVTLEWENA